MYRERRFLVHATKPDYQGWFYLTWLVNAGVHFLIHMERENA